MSFEIRPATREGIKPLVGFYGKSGSGKTMSSLLFARGIVGPTGRIGMIDTENRRGSIFADLIPGGYSVLDLDAPFSPQRYIEAIEYLESKVDIVVVDSMSHEWTGEGGVLDMQEAELYRMAKDDYARREACKMASWIKPKMEHKAMVNRFLRCKLPLICCLRGEEKTHMVKGQGGEKNKVITDEFSSPIADPRFIFELLINFETVNREGKGGYVYVVKTTHPAITPLLPGEREQVGVKHGEALAAWCAKAGGTTAATAPAAAPAPAPAKSGAKTAVATEKTRLWALEQLKPYGEQLVKSFFELKGWVAPFEKLEDWPFAHVPTSTAAIRSLMAEIEKFRETGNV